MHLLNMPRIMSSMMSMISSSLDERGLDIELGEFRLAVGAQVFVAEAFGDLEVAVEAGDHQQLLEQLRRLRQREELAVDERGTAPDSRARLPAWTWSASAFRLR